MSPRHPLRPVALLGSLVLALSLGTAALGVDQAFAATAPLATTTTAGVVEGPDPGYPGLAYQQISAGGTYQNAVTVNPGAYPYATQTNPSAADPWGFAERQCVSYAAWWLNNHGVQFSLRTRGPSGIGDFLDASTWAAATQYAGWAVSATPRPGAIAQWNADESSSWTGANGWHYTMTAGASGHVAVVLSVAAGGLATMAEYNGDGTRTFSIITGTAPRYLYIGNPAAPVVAARTPSVPAPPAVQWQMPAGDRVVRGDTALPARIFWSFHPPTTGGYLGWSQSWNGSPIPARPEFHVAGGWLAPGSLQPGVYRAVVTFYYTTGRRSVIGPQVTVAW